MTQARRSGFGETAAALASQPPASVRATKRLLRSSRGADYASAWRAECVELERCMSGEELQEASRAFLEKRPADFSRFA